MRQIEDGVRADRAWRTRQPHLAGPERDDARPVGGDGRVVARQPKPARRVALSIRQLREEDVSAGVEPCLEPRSVVTCVDACGRSRRREHERHQRGERQISPTTHENPRAAEYLRWERAYAGLRFSRAGSSKPSWSSLCSRREGRSLRGDFVGPSSPRSPPPSRSPRRNRSCETSERSCTTSAARAVQQIDSMSGAENIRAANWIESSARADDKASPTITYPGRSGGP